MWRRGILFSNAAVQLTSDFPFHRPTELLCPEQVALRSDHMPTDRKGEPAFHPFSPTTS
ncbi:unnamed protein product [Protopolystoma xenopodis]|uniref:Uncharacterized protein n=1 Tax=Protopolystoma xenopodis TaxID=117903 RepID=A0A3S5CRJ6_9PLAT|nr:unnamed protein product [Protopolystoma xenopodis]